MFSDSKFEKVLFPGVVVYRKELLMCFRVNETDGPFLTKPKKHYDILVPLYCINTGKCNTTLLKYVCKRIFYGHVRLLIFLKS